MNGEKLNTDKLIPILEKEEIDIRSLDKISLDWKIRAPPDISPCIDF